MPTFFVSALLAVISTQVQADTVANLSVNVSEPTQYISMVGVMDGRMQTPPEPDYSLVWPTTSHRISRGISAGHTGVDIDGETDDPVFAIFDGDITLISREGPYGNKIIINHSGHPDQLVTLYAHLNTINVTTGQHIKTGEHIGTLGSTGNATGSHLHIEVYQPSGLSSLMNWF